MGATTSKLERALVDLPDGEKYFGLENFGNTCYCNSVLQALYFCKPFRERLLQYASVTVHNGEENLLTALADLFTQISTQKRKTGVVQPKRFVQRLKRDNELFRGHMHQDAHEFLNFLLNEASDVLEKERREAARRSGALPPGGIDGGGSTRGGNQFTGGGQQQQQGGAGSPPAPPKTWVEDLFQGRWVNETRCLRCETVTSREETWLEWSLEIEPNSSVTGCLRNFSATETLDAENKFFCDACGCLQEAQKRVKCRELPRVMCLHLKRFYIEAAAGRMRKLTHRVVFPFDLKLSNTTEDCPGADCSYALSAVVVHVGGGINHGHYVALVKSAGSWLFFDDESVEPISEAMVQTTFGSTSEYGGNNMDHGYILLYERQQQQQQQGAGYGHQEQQRGGANGQQQHEQRQRQGQQIDSGGIFGGGGGFGFGSSASPMES